MTYYSGEGRVTESFGDAAGKAEAGNFIFKNTIDRRPVLLYLAPGEPAPSPIRVGARELEMVRALRGSPKTRVELSERRPRLGLTGPATVERLRRKGLQIESLWREGTDADSRAVRFLAYELKGRVLRVES